MGMETTGGTIVLSESLRLFARRPSFILHDQRDGNSLRAEGSIVSGNSPIVDLCLQSGIISELPVLPVANTKLISSSVSKSSEKPT